MAFFVVVHSCTTDLSLASNICNTTPEIFLLFSSTLVTSSCVFVSDIVTLIPLPSVGTVNCFETAFAYPSGGVTSSSVYVFPDVSVPLITCASLVLVHWSITVFPSFTLKTAPANGLSFSSVFKIFIFVCVSVILIVWVSPLLLTVNSISCDLSYPPGAVSSCNLYVFPGSRFPLILCAWFVLVHSSITKSPSFTCSNAPANGLSSSSTFKALTFIFLSVIVIAWLVWVLSAVNVTSSALIYPFGAFTSCNVYSLPSSSFSSINVASAPLVNEYTTWLFSSNICNCAPETGFPSSSTLLIVISVVFILTLTIFPYTPST